MLEQIRSGKPLDEVLTGAILFEKEKGGGGAGEGGPLRCGDDASYPASSDRAGARVSALREASSGGAGGAEEEEAMGSPDVLAAKAAARAMDRMREQRDVERKAAAQAAAAESAAAVLRAEKDAETRARAEATEALAAANAVGVHADRQTRRTRRTQKHSV